MMNLRKWDAPIPCTLSRGMNLHYSCQLGLLIYLSSCKILCLTAVAIVSFWIAFARMKIIKIGDIIIPSNADNTSATEVKTVNISIKMTEIDLVRADLINCII